MITETFWLFDLSPARTGASAILVIGAVYLSILLYRRGGFNRKEGWIEGLRLIAVILVAVTFLRPERIQRAKEDGLPVLAVLLDHTGSMDTKDVTTPEGGFVSRKAWMEPLIEESFWSEKLGGTYQVVIQKFEDHRSEDTASPDGGTDLASPLRDWALRPGAARGVVLVSDGDWTTGESPIEPATRLRQQNTPVCTVTIGADRFLPDLALLPVQAPAFAQTDESVYLPILIQSRMPDTVRSDLVLREEGVERIRRSLVIPAMSQLSTSLSFTPQREGEWSYTVHLTPAPDETRTDNNQQAFRLAVRRDRTRILIVDTMPRWEYRYLRNAAVRDPYVEVDTLLLHPGMDTGRGSHYRPSFPAFREELAAYDVFFIGDVSLGPDGLSLEQCEWLKEVVESQASGLVFLPGPSGRWLSLLHGPLGDLVPVHVDTTRLRGHGSPVEGRLALTARGRDHRLTRLAVSPEENARLWAQLPGFNWYASALNVKPGAEVLAVHAAARNEEGRIPLMVTRTQGNGKVLFMGFDSAWRWRRGVEDLHHYRFWSQIFRWMAHQRHMARDEGIRFFYAPESPVRNDRLHVQATPLDALGFPLEHARVDAILSTPEGRSESFELLPVEKSWGLFRGELPVRSSGAHTLTVRVRETGQSASVDMMIAEPDIEPVGRPARPDVMREIAAVTGGAAFDTGSLDALFDALLRWPERPPVETRFRLWNHPLWLSLMTLLFTLYWMGRKWVGRV